MKTGSVNISLISSGSFSYFSSELSNNIQINTGSSSGFFQSNTSICGKKLIGGSTISATNISNISFIFNNPQNLYKYYMKMIIIELLTNELNSPQFSFSANGVNLTPSYVSINASNCSVSKLQSFYSEMYFKDDNYTTILEITNTLASFWGVVNYNITYFLCNFNCDKCFGPRFTQCSNCISNLFYVASLVSQNIGYCVCRGSFARVSTSMDGLLCDYLSDLSIYLFNQILIKIAT